MAMLAYLHFLPSWNERSVVPCPAFLLVEMGSCELFAQAGLKLCSP
jgi:hypothetical protein